MALPLSGIGLPQGQIGVGSAFPTLPGGRATGGASVGDTLQPALGEVSAAQDNAQSVVAAYLRGDQVELHQVMAATEEAGIALELLVEIRNKLTEAYRSVINMQS
jgi:flagellar hook-basal body complex protein FliE